MFNDERINYEMSKLKKLIIILGGVLGLIFLIYKMLANVTRDLQFHLYSTEIIVTVTSIVLLLGSLLVRADEKDELYIQKKAKYYHIAFKVFLYISFISYALVIPATIVSGDNVAFSSNNFVNMIMMSSLFIGYAYLRLKKIYFNYNIIEEDRKTYYKNVFKNMLKILKFFGIVYLIALVVSIFYMAKYKPLSFIFTIVLAFVISVISNCLYYLFISFLERLFYKEENKKKIKTPTLILLSISAFFLLSSLICNIVYQLIIGNVINTPDSVHFIDIIGSLSVLIGNLTEFCRFFSVLGITFLVTDVANANPLLLKRSRGLLISFIIFMVMEIIWNRCEFMINFMLHDSLISDDTYYIISLMIQKCLISLKSLYYIVVSILVLCLFKNSLKNLGGFIALLTLWIVNYFFILLSYVLERRGLIFISGTFGIIVLTIISTIYLIVSYNKKTNISY